MQGCLIFSAVTCTTSLVLTYCFVLVLLRHVQGVKVTLGVLAEVLHPTERLMAGAPFTLQLQRRLFLYPLVGWHFRESESG